jgi:hypothetical protein
VAAFKTLYVLFLNRLYFDEIYDAFFVKPNLWLARQLQDIVETRVIDRMLQLITSASLGVAGWLLRVLEGRGIDRAVTGSATASVATAKWLWRVLEGRAIQGNVDRLAKQAHNVGHFFQQTEMHTLQEHLLLVVGGMAALLGVIYFAVLGG